MFKRSSKSKSTVISNVTVGKAQAHPTGPSHVRGVKAGNAPGNFDRETGIEPTEDGAHATMRRSSGVNADAHSPIDPRMPILTPP
jgi:hypothetical protein